MVHNRNRLHNSNIKSPAFFVVSPNLATPLPMNGVKRFHVKCLRKNHQKTNTKLKLINPTTVFIISPTTENETKAKLENCLHRKVNEELKRV